MADVYCHGLFVTNITPNKTVTGFNHIKRYHTARDAILIVIDVPTVFPDHPNHLIWRSDRKSVV